MEDEKKMSAPVEETQNEVAEIVQQEAELPNENEEQPEQNAEQSDVAASAGSEKDEVVSLDEHTDDLVAAPSPPDAAISDGIEAPKDTDSPPATVQESENSTLENGEDSEEDTEEDDEYSAVELDGSSKNELLAWLKKIRTEENLRRVDHLFKDIGHHFETLFEEEKKSALEDFLAIEGNEETDFEFKGEEIDKEFHALYEEQRHKRSHYFHQLEKQREENLIQKNQILDMIREIVDGEDQTSFTKVKKLQEEWKKVGPVPGAQNKTLWANYNALMDRFYDQRTIYFELKDLDRKKNLQAKIELCERAEAIDPEKDVKRAIVLINELHEEFKHIGPVPKEDQEPLWERFKAASDVVYEHRREYTELQKEEFRKNLEKKTEIASKIEEFANFNSDSIKDWNAKTKELLDFQKEWEAVGGVPREKARAINKSFWGGFKTFFSNKNRFFKGLDAQKGDNLEKKQQLVARAKELSESKDWEATAKAFKDLQDEWRNIGHVPEKFKKSLFKEFKKHCDTFFDLRRGQSAEQNKEFIANLEKKKVILDAMEESLAPGKFDIDVMYDLADQFSEAGLVPRNAVGKTLSRYEKVTKQILTSNVINPEEINDLRIHFDVCKLRNTPHGNQKISRKENTLKRKISGLENDINNWKTNIDFFGNSANAEQLKAEFQVKIRQAEEDLESMKQQLRHMH